MERLQLADLRLESPLGQLHAIAKRNFCESAPAARKLHRVDNDRESIELENVAVRQSPPVNVCIGH
jgi:hypothetical protein